MARSWWARSTTALLGLVVGAVTGVCAALLASPGQAATWVPPDKTIVKVTGNRVDGFGVHHFDGTALFPPTDSEAYAECGEYDTAIAVATCRTEVRVWYRDLGKLKQSLQWARWVQNRG